VENIQLRCSDNSSTARHDAGFKR